MIIYYEIQLDTMTYSVRPKKNLAKLDFLFLLRLQVTGTEIKCVEGYRNIFLFFPLCFWMAETAPEAPKSSDLRQEWRCSPLGSFCGEKAAMAKSVRALQGECTPAGSVSPAEMLIAKQR